MLSTVIAHFVASLSTFREFFSKYSMWEFRSTREFYCLLWYAIKSSISMFAQDFVRFNWAVSSSGACALSQVIWLRHKKVGTAHWIQHNGVHEWRLHQYVNILDSTKRRAPCFIQIQHPRCLHIGFGQHVFKMCFGSVECRYHTIRIRIFPNAKGEVFLYARYHHKTTDK